jgi:small subunit ribosomal protein S16
MLMIKLSKVGKINKKLFRLIILEKARDPFGRVLENLGSYNPYTKELQSKDERIKYWLGKGAKMTATVNNLLVGKNIITGEKVIASKPGKKNKKRLEQIKAKKEKETEKSDDSKEESTENKA